MEFNMKSPEKKIPEEVEREIREAYVDELHRQLGPKVDKERLARWMDACIGSFGNEKWLL
jgi:hypothetical protein